MQRSIIRPEAHRRHCCIPKYCGCAWLRLYQRLSFPSRNGPILGPASRA